MKKLYEEIEQGVYEHYFQRFQIRQRFVQAWQIQRPDGIQLAQGWANFGDWVVIAPPDSTLTEYTITIMPDSQFRKKYELAVESP